MKNVIDLAIVCFVIASVILGSRFYMQHMMALPEGMMDELRQVAIAHPDWDGYQIIEYIIDDVACGETLACFPLDFIDNPQKWLRDNPDPAAPQKNAIGIAVTERKF
jgi:hypothetical protein